MIYRRRIYRTLPDRVETFTAFFEEYLLPNQRKHGARLVGRYMNEERTEIMALFEYDSMEAYRRIHAAVTADPMHEVAQARRAELGPLYLEYKDEFLTPTGNYHVPKQIVAVSVFVTNQAGECLLVRTNWRPDTWELPGGQVEEGEPLHAAARREVLEETGLEVAIAGVTGVYHNQERGIVNVVFQGQVTGGLLCTSTETQEVAFHPVDPALLDRLVTRPHFRSRIRDAMAGTAVPYEAYRVNPPELLTRLPQGEGN